jgi:UDP-N-acetylglucosamine transferase subunit ALG13
MRKNKALFAISNLWLWHATRTLAVINMYLDKKYEIDIISYWYALTFLKDELKSEKINFIELEEYPHLERWNGIMFYYYLLIDLFNTRKLIKQENIFIKNIEHNYDFIFSDGKYWIYSKTVPSFLLSHQLSFVVPKLFIFYKNIVDYFNKRYFKNFRLIFIPDYSDEKLSLAWKLSHPKRISSIDHKYIWILSSFYDQQSELDKQIKIDYLFIVSWYLLENKQNFVDKLIFESKKLDWKKVFILWDTSTFYKKELENDITIYSYVSWKQRKIFFENAWIIISRSGYTTIMDCIELDKKAIFFPTKNQTEQEYLASFLKYNNYFVIWNDSSKLEDLILNIKNTSYFKANYKTKQALNLIDKEIDLFL